MKHVGLYFLAAICFVFAGIVVVSNRTALTTGHEIFAGILIVFGAMLAGGADAQKAGAGVVNFAKGLKGAKDGAP